MTLGWHLRIMFRVLCDCKIIARALYHCALSHGTIDSAITIMHFVSSVVASKLCLQYYSNTAILC